MFHNPRLYKHLKDATKATSDLLQDIKSGQIDPKVGRININAMIKGLPSFKSCVSYLMESEDIKWLYDIGDQEKRRKEIKKTILCHIKKYLDCPYLNILMEIL